MTFVTTFNCKTADNIYVKKLVSLLGSENEHSYLVNIYGSNHSLTMTHASRNMSL